MTRPPKKPSRFELISMQNIRSTVVLAAACILTLIAGPALSQQKSGGSVVCWKDKSGKTVGCGDKVPPEYQDNANSTLNKRGVTVNQSDVTQTPEQQRSQQSDAEKKKREEEKRRDRALLDSFTTEKDIDLKRARDIQQIENGIAAQQSYARSLTDRQSEARVKIDQLKKENKPVPSTTQQEFDRATSELANATAQIAQKRKELTDRNQEFDDMKKRFRELTGATPAAPSATAPAAKK